MKKKKKKKKEEEEKERGGGGGEEEEARIQRQIMSGNVGQLDDADMTPQYPKAGRVPSLARACVCAHPRACEAERECTWARARVCVCVRACVRACVCMCVCVCVTLLSLAT